MKRSPLRARSRPNQRHFRPFLEQLEDRSLLSAFASIQGELATPQEKDVIPIHISAADFTLHRWGLYLGFELHAQEGSQFNPSQLQFQTHGKSLAAIPWSSSVSPQRRSVTLATVRAGNFQLVVGGDQRTTGAYQVDVFLVGDANGNGRVDKRDVQLIHALRGKLLGQPGYVPDVDANRDGVINATDEGLARANSGAATRIRPLTLSAAIDPASVLGGIQPGAHSDIVIVGQTGPHATLQLDQGADGSFEQSLGADPQGRYQFAAQVGVDVSQLRVLATDSFGQHATADLTVTHARSLTVHATLDTPHAASATIASGGGTVSTVGADGSSYGLVIPSGALASQQTISLTPAASVQGLPLNQFFAVQFGPSGLHFDPPATLTIQAPAGVDLAGGVAFVFDDSGENFELIPVQVQGSTLTFQVNHFSDTGFATGSPEDVLAVEEANLERLTDPRRPHVPTAAETQAKANLLAHPSDVGIQTQILDAYFRFDGAVEARLRAAVTDATALPSALVEFSVWISLIQNVSQVNVLSPGTIANEYQLGYQLALAGVNNAIDTAYRHTNDFARPPITTPVVGFWVQTALALELNGFDLAGQSKKIQSLRATILEFMPPATIQPGHAAEIRIKAGFTVGGVLHLGPAALYQDTGTPGHSNSSDWLNPPTVDPPLRIALDLTGATENHLVADYAGSGIYTAAVTLADNSSLITGTATAIYKPTDAQGISIVDRKPISILAVKLTLQARFPADASSVSIPDICAANDGQAHLTATLTNLNGGPLPLKLVQFSLSGGGSLDATGVTTNQDGKAVVNFTAPHDGTGVSTVTATFGTGAGAASKSFDVHYGPAVTVTPVLAALNPGTTAQFSADVCGSANKAVTWSATGGTISSTGLYTAGSTVGPFVVTATSKADTSKKGQATIQIQTGQTTPGIVGTWSGQSQGDFSLSGGSNLTNIIFAPDMHTARITVYGRDPFNDFAVINNEALLGNVTLGSFDGQKTYPGSSTVDSLMATAIGDTLTGSFTRSFTDRTLTQTFTLTRQ
jgi:hypothetical protein